MRLTCFAEQVGDRLRHGQVGLAGAGRADAEDDVVLVDGVEILPLIDTLGDDLPLARRARRAAQEVVGQLDLLVLRDELRSRPHVALGQLVSAAQQRGELLQDTLGARHIGRLAFDNHLVSTRPGADVRTASRDA